MTSGADMTCAECSEPLAGAARFCASCGAPVAAPPVAQVRKTVTLLFCDVTGSTALGEQLDPEALRGVMGRYFAVASAAVERHGGTVEKFVGDAVLAVFGIPEVREDDALRAVRAATDLRAALTELSDELVESLQVRLSVRTGVNTGAVVAGAARAGGAFATGDAVNTAARLEQAAAPGEILLGATTYSLVRDAVEVEAVEPLKAKGKSELLPAYRLVRVLDTDTGRARRLDAALVGRDREFRALQDALARTTQDHRGQLVTVLGAAGMGKTRLVEQFLAGVDDEVRVLRGRCISYGRGITFWPVVQLIRQAAGLTGEETYDDARHALAAIVEGEPNEDAVLDRLLPMLGVGGEPGGTEETFWAVRVLLEHLASQQPLLVVVDDIHWAEPTLLDLLERIRDEARDVALLLVCQARPELLEQRPTWGGGALNATTFNLEAFSGDETTALLEGLLGSGLPREVVDTVGGWAGGNPLFVEEVATHLVEAGLLRRDGEAWVLTGDLSIAPVPATVSALLAARLERLPAAELALVERVSVVGLEVTLAEARALSPDTTDVPDLLASLCRRDLLRRARGPRPDTFAFRHVLVREAAYEALPKSVRAELHERYAERLDEESGDAGREVAAFVGHHLELAARYQQELSPGAVGLPALRRRAADRLAEAGNLAHEAEDLPAAAGLLRRALALSDEQTAQARRLLWQIAFVDGERGYHGEAAEAARRIAALLPPDAAEAERVAAGVMVLEFETICGERHDPALLESLGGRAAHLARAAGEPLWLVSGLSAVASAGMMAGRWDRVLQAAQELGVLGDAAARRRANELLGTARFFGSTPVEEVLAVVQEANDRPDATPRLLFRHRCIESSVLAAMGRVDDGVAIARELAAYADAEDLQLWTTMSFFITATYVAAGDNEAALDVLNRGIDTYRKGGGLAFASTLLGWKALLLLEADGREAEAEVLLEEADAVTSPHDSMSVSLVASGRAVLAARAGRHVEAASLLATALTTIDRTDEVLQQADARRWLSEVPRLAGDSDGERGLLEAARDRYHAKGDVVAATRTESLLAARTP